MPRKKPVCTIAKLPKKITLADFGLTPKPKSAATIATIKREIERATP